MAIDAGEIVKKVRTDFSTKGLDQVARKAKKASVHFAKAAKHAGWLKNALRGIGRAAMTPMAALGIGGILGAVIKIGKRAQDTKMQLTSMLVQAGKHSNLPIKGFDQATKAAVRLRQQIREIAVASPATSAAITDAFATLALPMSKAGLGLNKQVGLARDVAAREMIAGLDKGVLARDISQLMSGEFNAAEMSFKLFKEQGIGGRAAGLAKKGDKAGAAKVIQETLALSRRELDAFGDSFTGVWSSATDAATQFGEEVAKPLMKFLIEKMKVFTKWVKNNKKEVKELAKLWGERIVKAMKAIFSIGKWIADNWDTIVTAAKTFALVVAGVRLGQLAAAGWSMARGIGAAWRNAGGLGKALGKIGAGAAVAGAVASGVAALVDENQRVEFRRRFARTAGRGAKFKSGLSPEESSKRDQRDTALISGMVASYRADPKKFRAAQLASEHAIALAGLMRQDQRPLLAPIGGYKPTTPAGLSAQAMVSASLRSDITVRTIAAFAKKAEIEKQKNAFDDFDPTKGGAGGGKKKLKKLEVDRMEVRAEDFARLMTPFIHAISAASAGQRPLTATFGLGALSVPDGSF